MKVAQLQVVDELAKVPKSIQRQVPMIQDMQDQKPEEAQISPNVRRSRLRVQRACTTHSPYFKGTTYKVEVQKDQTSVHKCKARCKEREEGADRDSR